MNDSPEKKTVLVEIYSNLGEPFQEDPFEVSFVPSIDGSKPDIELLGESLSRKSKKLKTVLDASTFKLQRQSLVNKETMVEIGEDSPLKNQSTVRCVYKPKLNTNASKSVSELQSSSSPGPSTKRTSENLVDERPLQQSANKQQKVQSVKCLPKDFKLPVKYSAQVQSLMDDPNAVFTLSQINQVVRDVAKSMWTYTEQPTTAELEIVVKMLVSKYPHLRLTANKLSTPESNVKALIQNLREKFNRWRISIPQENHAGNSISKKKKRGRPKKELPKTNAPGSKVPLPNGGLTDQISYDSNVTEMIRLSADPLGNRSAIEVLLETTFVNRRLLIKSGTERITEFVNRDYPVFKLQPYLLFEMEMIFPSSINNIRQKWLELVPFIIAAARLMKNKKIEALLKHPRFDKIKEDFDTQSRAACELLPLCLPGSDKSINGPRHFFDYREESADRVKSIAALPNRNAPFILSLGKALHLAIEKQHWLQIDGPSSDAVLILLAAYYVLDLNYSQNVKPALVFLQTELLGIAEEETGNASGLTFYNMLEKVKHIATSDSEVQ